MKKAKQLDALGGFGRLLAQSHLRVQQLGELLAAGGAEAALQHEELRLRELDALEKEASAVVPLINRHAKPLRLSAEAGQAEAARRAQQARREQLEEHAQMVFAHLKVDPPAARGLQGAQLRFGDLASWFRRFEDANLVLLFPRGEPPAPLSPAKPQARPQPVSYRTGSLAAEAEPPAARFSPRGGIDYEEFSAHAETSACIIDLRSFLALHLVFRARRQGGEEARPGPGESASLAFVDLSIHSVFESARGFRLRDAPAGFFVEASRAAREKFAKFQEETPLVSLFLPLSEIPLCNQLALGLRQKLALSSFPAADSLLFVSKLCEYGRRFLAQPLSSESALCSLCGKFSLFDKDKVIYPYLNKNNSFVHPGCFDVFEAF